MTRHARNSNNSCSRDFGFFFQRGPTAKYYFRSAAYSSLPSVAIDPWKFRKEVQVLLIKLLLTPVLMLAVSWAARRWGPGIGGLLAGLPLTSGPISIYLCAEQGPHFAASAAANSILSLMPVALFSVVYSRLAERQQMATCALGSFAAFLLSLYFLPKSGFPFWSAWITGFLAISIGLILLQTRCRPNFKSAIPNGIYRHASSRRPRWFLLSLFLHLFLDLSGVACFRPFRFSHGLSVHLSTINRAAMELELCSVEFWRALTAY